MRAAPFPLRPDAGSPKSVYKAFSDCVTLPGTGIAQKLPRYRHAHSLYLPPALPPRWPNASSVQNGFNVAIALLLLRSHNALPHDRSAPASILSAQSPITDRHGAEYFQCFGTFIRLVQLEMQVINPPLRFKSDSSPLIDTVKPQLPVEKLSTISPKVCWRYHGRLPRY